MAQDIQSLLGSRFDVVEITREQRSGWKVGIVPSFLGGINDELPADLIKDSEVPLLDNLSFIDGRLKSDTGYVPYATWLREAPKGVFEHRQADGSTTRLCITNKTAYKYNVTNNAWQVIKGTDITTLTVNLAKQDTQITVDDTTGFAVGAVFGIEMDDGSQMIREVDTLPGSGVVTFIGAAGIGGTVIATSGNNVTLGAILAGDNNNQVVWAAVPDQEWSVFTNGVDPPYRYDATDDDVVTIASLSSGTLAETVVCKTLAMYKSALVLANLIEAGVYKNYKIQWARPGNPTDWAAGNSGTNSLLDSRDAIIAMKLIGSNLGIYRANSIVTMAYQGATGDGFFRFDTSIPGELSGSQGVGAVSPNAVFALPDEAIVMTSDGLYLYRGGSNIELISDPIFNGTFGARGDMDGANLGQNFIHFFNRTNEVFCFYRSTAATAFPDKALVFNLSSGKFRKRSFIDEIAAVGDNSTADTFTSIDDLVGTIDEQSWLLGSAAAASAIGTLMLCAVNAVQVMEYNYITPNDDGTDISWEMQTKDFHGVNQMLIVDWVEFEFIAQNAAVSYSIDSGESWTEIKSIAGGIWPRIAPHRYSMFKTAKKFRFRLKGTGGGCQIGKLAFRFKESYIV